MNSQQIKANVQDYYGAIALNRGSCCEPSSNSCCGSASGVSPVALFASPDSMVIAEADLGLSCGNPTQLAAIRPGDTVLDLGSGAGVDVFRAALATGHAGRVIGVDMTPAMVDRARDNAARGGFDNVEFRLGEIEALPVADTSVNVVLSNCVINLVPDKVKAFAEIKRVLKPGGRFSVSDIVSEGSVPDDVRSDMSAWAGCQTGAVDRQEYLDIIWAAGFVDVETQENAGSDANRDVSYRFLSITVVGRKP